MNSKRSRRWLLLLAILIVMTLIGFVRLPPKVTRGPYLQQSSPTSVAVRWRTDRPARTIVHYGLTPDRLVTDAQIRMKGTDHGIVLAGLNPGTKYYYEVEPSPGAPWRRKRMYIFSTPPPKASTQATRVWVLGDSGTGNRTQKAVRDAFYRFTGSRHADVWLMLGDNAYSKGSDREHQKALFDIYPDTLSSTALWPALGNHDASSADPRTQSGVYFDVFSLPSQGQCGGVMSGTEAYYSFDHANIHFVCLDSEGSDRSPQGPMLTWLKKDLNENRQDWTIAFFHQPPYTKGSHDSDDARDSAGGIGEIRENVVPILEQAGVDLVLCGHSHNYERSYLLDGHYGLSRTLTEAMFKSKSDGRPDGAGPYVKPSRGPAPHEGTVYVVAGSSGQRARLGTTPHPAMCVSMSVAGSLVLDVQGLRLDALFLDEAGQTRDRFAIVKGNTNSLTGKPWADSGRTSKK